MSIGLGSGLEPAWPQADALTMTGIITEGLLSIYRRLISGLLSGRENSVYTLNFDRLYFPGLYLWADSAVSTVVTVDARASAHTRLTAIQLLMENICWSNTGYIYIYIYICMMCICLYICGFYVVYILLQGFPDVLNKLLSSVDWSPSFLNLARMG